MQQLLPELTLDGLELLVERLVSEGTSEPESSESYSESSSSEDSSSFCSAKRRFSASSVVLSYCVLMTWRVSWGRCGLGATMRSGLRPRPLGMDAVETRRDLRSAWLEDVVFDLAAGMSMMLSLRPVVGSVVWSLAGSCETW